VNGASVRERKS